MTRERRLAGAGVVLVVVLVAGCLGAIPADEPTRTEPGRATAGPAAGNGTLEVHFINVGQSESALIVAPSGETMLVDTGHYTDDGEHVLSYLRARGVERLDHLVVTHNDADHIGGNAAVIEYYETEADGVGAVHDPGIAASTRTYEEYLDAIEEHGVPLYETREGDSIRLEGVTVRVLGPPEPYLEDGARNENSIVLELGHGQTSFLLPGDAEDDQEEYLVSTYGDRLEATVLKAGHHGSASSTSGPLLDAVRPRAVVISSAYDSRYGHPHEEVLSRLAERSIPTYWTATHGDVVFVSDGTDVTVRTQEAAPTAPLSIRAGDPTPPGADGDVVPRGRLGGTPVARTAPADGSGTAVATDGGEPTGTLAVAAVHADAAGDDRENLADEYVVFENAGTARLDLSGWTVADATGKSYTFPDGTTLDPGGTVTLRTGSGTDTATERYWGASGPVWNNDGDTVVVRNSEGELVRRVTYD